MAVTLQLLPFHFATLASAILRLLIAGLGTYGFVRRLGVSYGPAVLAALTVSLAFGNSDGGTPIIEAPEVIALLVSGAVAAWRRNLVQTLVVGMTTFWICSALI